MASIPGCVVSFLIFCMIFLYGTHKLGQLISKSNPNVSSYVEKSIFTSDDILNLKENGIRIAFGFEGYLDGEFKDDPRYVKHLVRMWGKSQGKKFETLLPYHRCTEDDYN